MKARVPTLPTPTTLRAMSTISNRSQEVAAVLLQGVPIGAELLVDHLLDLVRGVPVHGFEIARRDDHRRLADDPVPTVDHLGQLRQCLEAVAVWAFWHCLLGSLRALLGLGSGLLRLPPLVIVRIVVHDLLLGQPGVPDVHVAHLGELAMASR